MRDGVKIPTEAFSHTVVNGVVKIRGKLTAKEKGFCMALLESGDVSAAAERSGVDRRIAGTMLCREEIVAELEREAKLKKRAAAALSVCGYEKLAFGKISDAVSLLLGEKPTPEELEKMDLSMISEIRRPKSDAVEIKFYDRMKALERLECEADDNGGAKNIFDAISSSAKALSGGENGY